MKWRRAQPFQDGEWTRGGATNCPACYVGGIRPTVKARFGAQPVDLGSAVLGAEAVDGGFVLGNLPPKRVAFSGGFSDWVDFDGCDGTNAIPVCVRRQQGSWEWSVTNVQGRAFAKFCVATSGPHKVYSACKSIGGGFFTSSDSDVWVSECH